MFAFTDEDPAGSCSAALLTAIVGLLPPRHSRTRAALTEGAGLSPFSGGGTASEPGGTWVPARVSVMGVKDPSGI